MKEKVDEVSLVEQTQKRILQYIDEKGIQNGEALPKESELVEILAVSRVVVREALSSLRILGLVETRRKKGTVLTSPDIFGTMNIIVNSGALNLESLRDLYELRLMIEIGMSDFVFMNKTDADIAHLSQIVAKENRATSTEESIELDIQFHKTLYKISGNKSLESFQRILNTLFSIYAPRTDDWQIKQIITHAGLIEVLKSGNADSFRSAMRLHLNTQFENMQIVMKSLK
ncbi:FadR/GntR family transcriptional regulator [Sphingobacterium sp. SYP-B4668]|uniref:FadR/GntR family transcriptional regulator n=1 Tax=Sphingobacterium sp. SYP-B4668 TaxID=2996035 RepID=UPI0022DD4361|nr:FCD domain-containing protein [Sphingobacterium sp. SYP-B4668]